ncbi:thyrostimulin alpha-2 subunit [Galendromus occidentalis]|uniref:Thyrostimulin alpha-2 subunit n=1 Tax=Galendromus occidentalis TaxID=34638 RepID=A0AAJ6QWP0_9ACAR|nr:thyrostimulin alpha-2 subunit [Galendromus occidentalis]
MFMLWLRTLLTCAVIAVLSIDNAEGSAMVPWWRPSGNSCIRVGHKRVVEIPNCVRFEIATNACRGYCISYATPSPENTRKMNRNQSITSYAQCCSIVETEEVKVNVRCLDGIRQLVFKSAKRCECGDHCKKY